MSPSASKSWSVASCAGSFRLVPPVGCCCLRLQRDRQIPLPSHRIWRSGCEQDTQGSQPPSSGASRAKIRRRKLKDPSPRRRGRRRQSCCVDSSRLPAPVVGGVAGRGAASKAQGSQPPSLGASQAEIRRRKLKAPSPRDRGRRGQRYCVESGYSLQRTSPRRGLELVGRRYPMRRSSASTGGRSPAGSPTSDRRLSSSQRSGERIETKGAGLARAAVALT